MTKRNIFTKHNPPSDYESTFLLENAVNWHTELIGTFGIVSIVSMDLIYDYLLFRHIEKKKKKKQQQQQNNTTKLATI